MKKSKNKSSTTKSTQDSDQHSNVKKEKIDQKCKNEPTEIISDALCICSRCKKLCLITAEFWAPPSQSSPKKAFLSNESKTFQIYLGNDKKWQFKDSFIAFNHNSSSNNHFLFPCCPSCFNLLSNQIQLNNDFYSTQESFFKSPETNSPFIKNTYLLRAETKIDYLKKETSSLNEIVNDNKQKLLKMKSDQPSVAQIKYEDPSPSNPSKESSSNSIDDDEEEIIPLCFKDECIQSQGILNFSYRSLGLSGISLCLAFRITTRRHYGCINGLRIGTMTPEKVPTKEFDQGLFFLAQLVKNIAQLAKVDTPNLIISNSVIIYEEIKYEDRKSRNSKAFTTDAMSLGNFGHMKIKMKLFDKPKPKEKAKDIDHDDGKEEMISLSTMTSREKRELSGSADSFKPRFFSSEPIQLTASDLKTLRGIQTFRRAIAALMSIVWKVMQSSTIIDQVTFENELEDQGGSINGFSFEYDKQNPGQFTTAMKLLLLNLKTIQMKALESEVRRIDDE